MLGLLLALAASSASAKAGNSRGFALQPFLAKARGGATRTPPKNDDKPNDDKPKKEKVGVPLSQQTTLTEEEKPLLEDIETLSAILAETVNRVNPKIHDIYAQFRAYGLTR